MASAVWWPEDVASAVVRALAVTPVAAESATDAVRRYLGNKRVLLVIDNFEHVLDAAGLVGDLHAACPGIAILTTSREPLNLAAEHRFPVPRLGVPAVSDTTSVAEVEAADATSLFLASVRRRDNRFEVAPDNAPAIARICTRLDGLPLAVELAAARIGLLTVQELAARLDQALTDLGTGPRDAPARQQTLRAAIDWSYRLVDKAQQSAFVGFGVFAGGATVDAAQAVTGASLETFEALTAKSLLDRKRDGDGPTRLSALETMRQFALERLTEDPEHDALRRRHCDYYLHLAESTVPRLRTYEEQDALHILDSDIDNLRAAMRWALHAAPVDALRLAGNLGLY